MAVNVRAVGNVEPSSFIDVRSQVTGELLSVEFEEGQVTMASPIGRALLGKAVGEVAYLKLPTIVRQLKVVELRTIHDAPEEAL